MCITDAQIYTAVFNLSASRHGGIFFNLPLHSIKERISDSDIFGWLVSEFCFLLSPKTLFACLIYQFLCILQLQEEFFLKYLRGQTQHLVNILRY